MSTGTIVTVARTVLMATTAKPQLKALLLRMMILTLQSKQVSRTGAIRSTRAVVYLAEAFDCPPAPPTVAPSAVVVSMRCFLGLFLSVGMPRVAYVMRFCSWRFSLLHHSSSRARSADKSNAECRVHT